MSSTSAHVIEASQLHPLPQIRESRGSSPTVGGVTVGGIVYSETKGENPQTAEDPPTAVLAAIGKKAPVAIHTFSSQTASAISTMAFYPFDLLKTRYMSQDGTVSRQHNGKTYNSISRSLHTIWREEGMRTMFRGCSVAVCGSVTAWGLYMFIYRELCNWTEFSSFLGRSGLSITANLTASLMSSPIFLIKSRMQLEEATKSSNYRTFCGALRHTIETGGVRSLWCGVSLQLMLVFPNALGIPIYDTLKSALLSYRWETKESSRNLNIAEVCLCSTVTKVFLLTLSHPLVMMKVRLQDQRSWQGSIHYRSVAQTLVTILKTKGVRGLYRGYSTALVHSLPRSLLHYTIYEKSLNALCSTWNYAR